MRRSCQASILAAQQPKPTACTLHAVWAWCGRSGRLCREGGIEPAAVLGSGSASFVGRLAPADDVPWVEVGLAALAGVVCGLAWDVLSHRGLCGAVVFVDQAAEAVDPFDPFAAACSGWRGSGHGP